MYGYDDQRAEYDTSRLHRVEHSESPESPRPVAGRSGSSSRSWTNPNGTKVESTLWTINNKRYGVCSDVTPVMPSGEYLIQYSDDIGINFLPHTSSTDEIIELPDDVSDEVVKEIEMFWNSEEKFRKFNFLWKRGVLLWGPPGSGKTCTVHMMIKRIVEKGGVAFHTSIPNLAEMALQTFRAVEPKRPIAVILEDLDAIIKKQGEAELLALLDGEMQVDNVVFVATTNYPERLDKRIVNRPSRFDLVRRIGMPPARSREVFLRSKNHALVERGEKEIQRWLNVTDGFSIAHLKELIISVEVFGRSLESSAERLRKMIDAELDSCYNENAKTLGFE